MEKRRRALEDAVDEKGVAGVNCSSEAKGGVDPKVVSIDRGQFAMKK